MLINAANLALLSTGFSTAYQQGLGQAQAQWNRIATRVPSTNAKTSYGWLGQLPNIRKWVGDRVVHGISQHDYTIKNEPWELTIAVDRDSIEDDEYGVYTPLFTEMGLSTAAHPDMLCYGLLKDGFAAACYDGQNFFDTDHPVLDKAGNEESVANTDGGSGTPWFLIDDSRALKPILYQDRRSFQFVAKDKVTDDNVFDRKEFKYGVDGRNNVGFGFWQFAWGGEDGDRRDMAGPAAAAPPRRLRNPAGRGSRAHGNGAGCRPAAAHRTVRRRRHYGAVALDAL